MKALQEVMYAFARFLDKPRNPAYAAMDLFDKLNEHGAEAIKDYEEVVAIVQENANLEAENAEMRRMLRERGIIFRGEEEAA